MLLRLDYINTHSINDFKLKLKLKLFSSEDEWKPNEIRKKRNNKVIKKQELSKNIN